MIIPLFMINSRHQVINCCATYQTSSVKKHYFFETDKLTKNISENFFNPAGFNNLNFKL
jgi:hypothetical protein